MTGSREAERKGGEYRIEEETWEIKKRYQEKKTNGKMRSRKKMARM